MLNGKNMVIAYGPQNHIESFRASDVRTQTDPTADEFKRKVPVSVTSSRQMQATFEPKTSRMSSMEQTGEFRYDQGDRHATAAKATLDETQNRDPPGEFGAHVGCYRIHRGGPDPHGSTDR